MSAWMHVLVSLLGGGILLTLGLTKARAVSPASAWLFVAAGLLIPLSACCMTGANAAAEDAPDPEIVMHVATLLGSGADLLATAIITAAFIVLSRARTASPAA